MHLGCKAKKVADTVHNRLDCDNHKTDEGSGWVPPDMPTRTANQKRVSQAGGYCKQSFHFSTPVNSSTDKPAQQRRSSVCW